MSFFQEMSRLALFKRKHNLIDHFNRELKSICKLHILCIFKNYDMYLNLFLNVLRNIFILCNLHRKQRRVTTIPLCVRKSVGLYVGLRITRLHRLSVKLV